METLFGIRDRSQGPSSCTAKRWRTTTPTRRSRTAFALVTEERRSTGIYSRLDIAFNSLIANMDKYKIHGAAQRQQDEERYPVGHRLHAGQDTDPADPDRLPLGGNQQKVIIGRWLLTQPEILMLDEPTRGIDVGAKFEIYQLILELAKKDKGIVIISSEMPELLGITDRIMVMSNGRVAGIVNTKETTRARSCAWHLCTYKDRKTLWSRLKISI